MRFLKQNFLILIALLLLLISLYMLYDLQSKYDNLNSRYFMLQSSIQDITNNSNQFSKPVEITKEVKEVMTPTELAEYLRIELTQVYEIATRDNTMPYIMIDREYRFNKAAIDKWMETRKTIETR